MYYIPIDVCLCACLCLYIISKLLTWADAVISTDSSNIFDFVHEARIGFVRDFTKQATCST